MDTLNKLSGTQKFIIGLVVGLIVGGGGTYFAVDQGSWSKDKCAAGESAADCAARLAASVSDANSTSTDSMMNGMNMGNTAMASGATSTSGAEIVPVSVPGTNAVAVDDQSAGNAVEVTMATLSKVGWVVVQEDLEGTPGRVLGAHRYEPGIYLAHVDLLKPTVAGQKYFVVLDVDDGDKQFDLHKDMPILGSDGKVVMTSFMAK